MIGKRKFHHTSSDVLVLTLLWGLTAVMFFLVKPGSVLIVSLFLVLLFLALLRSINLIIGIKSISYLITLFIFAVFALKKLDQLTLFNGIVLLLLFGTLFYLYKPRTADRRRILG